MKESEERRFGVRKAFDGYRSLWAAHLAQCDNCVSGVRFLDLILVEIREQDGSLQGRKMRRKGIRKGEQRNAASAGPCM